MSSTPGSPFRALEEWETHKRALFYSFHLQLLQSARRALVGVSTKASNQSGKLEQSAQKPSDSAVTVPTVAGHVSPYRDEFEEADSLIDGLARLSKSSVLRSNKMPPTNAELVAKIAQLELELKNRLPHS